jgi:sorting nexin-25
MWLANLGNWKAKVFSISQPSATGDVSSVAFVTTVIELPGSVHFSADSCPSASIPFASWVVTRCLEDFVALRNELAVYHPSLHAVKLTMVPASYDMRTLEHVKKQLQEFLNRVHDTSVLACSEPVYVFFSPCRELVKQIATQHDGTHPNDRHSLFSRFLRMSSTIPASSSSANLVQHNDQTDDDAASDAIIQPLSRLFFELFELKSIINWLPRLLFSTVQAAYGKSISRQFRETVDWICSEPMLIYYLQQFCDAYWPDGKLAGYGGEQVTETEKLRMKRKAKLLLLHCTVDTTKLLMLMSEDQARYGITKVFEAFQDKVLNKHLFYTLLEVFMQQAYPEFGNVSSTDRPQ